MAALEALYLRCPPTLQHILVTLKGARHQYVHRSGDYHRFRHELAARRHWDEDQFGKFQQQRLGALLATAARHVPHYREQFRESGLGAGDPAWRDNFFSLPILEKPQLRANDHAFLDERVAPRRLLTIRTSGTTGSPLRIHADRMARRLNFAFFDDFLASWNADPRGRRAVFAGRVIASGAQSAPPFWRYSLMQRTALFSSFHLTEATLPAYADALQDFRPEIIDSYPSALLPLARYLLAHPRPQLRPRLIVTSSETLYGEQREVLEAAFRAPVADQYGSVEMAAFIGQCAHGRYHVRPDYGLVEILNDQDQPTAPGEVGHLVCTGLVNTVMPLIRYRIGDLASWSHASCTCGLATPVLEKLMGRQDDAIVTPDGRRVSRLGPVLRGLPIIEAQYVQTDPDRVVVRIVPGEGYNPEHTRTLTRELRERIGSGMNIAIELMDRIPRGPGGKLRTVVSNLPRAACQERASSDS